MASVLNFRNSGRKAVGITILGYCIFVCTGIYSNTLKAFPSRTKWKKSHRRNRKPLIAEDGKKRFLRLYIIVTYWIIITHSHACADPAESFNFAYIYRVRDFLTRTISPSSRRRDVQCPMGSSHNFYYYYCISTPDNERAHIYALCGYNRL